MKKLSVFLALISLAIFFIFSCKKEKDDVATVDYGHNNSLRTTVTGIVLDESNAPLSGVTVSAYGQTTSTNQYGTFVLKNLNVNKDRCVLQFAKAGFFKRSHGFIASGNTVNYLRIILLSNAATQSFSSSIGGTISLADGSSAMFQPNSFVTSNGSAYTGTVNLIVKHLSPDETNFGFMIPGGDLLGKDLNDKDVALYSYGMLGVELTGSSGEVLQLANGTSATLTMTIAASQLSSAPASIPLWYFDETTSLWKEEGAANKVGNHYEGTVNHFSWWNCDTGNLLAFVKGKVVDCNGVPVPNVFVSVINSYLVNPTDQNGEYEGLWLVGSVNLGVQVLSIYNNGFISNSQPESIPTLLPGETYIIPDLVVPCMTRVKGYIENCSGELTDGFISISNSTFYNYQYTTNGTFNLPAPPNMAILLYAVNSSNNYYTQNITSLIAPNDLNAGGLLLCDTLNSTLTNNFILNGASFSNQTFNVNLTSSSAFFTDTSGFPQTWILMTGTALPNFTISTYRITIDDTIPSTTYCEVFIIMTDGTNNYTVESTSPTCNLTQADMIGNKIKGNYYGTSIISVNNGNWIIGNISGSFDVIRTQ